MAKKFAFRGIDIGELQSKPLDELMPLMNSRARRKLKRGLNKTNRKLLANIKAAKGKDILVRTKQRDMIVLPEMVGAKIGIHTGREFKTVVIEEAMIGHYLGEFAMTRQKVKHSSPGFGATRSSKFVPLK